MNGRVRMASPDDAAAMLDIYAPYVKNTTVTFEYVPPEPREFRERVKKTLEQYPWLLFERDGAVLGYAYAGPNYTRPAFQWTAEMSVYVAPEAQGAGVASAQYDRLEGLLRAQGYRVLYAVICGENAPSIAFHKKRGYREIGYYKATGFKLGRWLDVTLMEKVLNGDRGAPEAPPMPVKYLSGAEK